jgi:hypothetical protein
VFLGIPGLNNIFDQALSQRILALLAVDYIDQATCYSWLNIWRLVNILLVILPLLAAIGLWLCVIDGFYRKEDRPMPPPGIRYFSGIVRIFRVVPWVLALFLAAIFLFRFVRYIVVNAPMTGGILFILSMALPECVLGAVVAVCLVIVIRCMDSAVNTADTIRYNMTLGTCESYGFSAAPSALLICLGLLLLALGFISRDYIFTMLSCICFALGLFLVAGWIHSYRGKNGKRAIEMRHSAKESD